VKAAVLGLSELEIAPFDPPTTKTLPRRTKHEVDRMTRYGDMAIRILTHHEGCIWDPHFERRGGHRESSIVPLELLRAMVVS